MRILELHIDGYGVFCDQHIRDFGDGVVLFSGPNEAGKSTLMSFVRGVLFGFERESQAGYYPPLSGGRHGGRLVVEMRDGDEVVVERYAERGQPKAPASVVGNMSKALYSNVFAFSLAELASLESLGSEEVRARIYSAGAGLGTRTLPEARKAVLSSIDKLYKRQGKVPAINAVLREIAELERLRGDLASRPAEFNEVVRNMDRLASEERRAREELHEVKARHQWFMALADSRKTWEQLVAARTLLDAFSEEDRSGGEARREAVLAMEPEIRRLKLEQASFVQLAGAIFELEAAVRERRRSYEERLRELGGAWDGERLDSVDVSPGVTDEIRSSRERIARQDAEVQRLAEVVRVRREAADEVELRLSRLQERREEFGESDYDARDDIVARIGGIGEAEGRLGRMGVLEAKAEGAQGRMDAARIVADDKVENVQSARDEIRRNRVFSRWLAPVCTVGLSIILALVMDRGAAVSFAVVLVGVCAAAAMALRALGRMRDANSRFERAMGEAEKAEEAFRGYQDEHGAVCDELRRLKHEYSLACRELFGEDDVDSVRLARERDVARDDLEAWDEMLRLDREWKQAAEDCRRAEGEWKRASKSQNDAAEELGRLREEWRSWLGARGMDSSFGHDAAERTVDAVREARRAQQLVIDAGARLDDARERAMQYVENVNAVARSLGLEETDMDRASVAVEELVAMAEEARADREARERAKLAVRELDAQFAPAFPPDDRKRAKEYHLLHTAEEIAALGEDAEERRKAVEARLNRIAEDRGRLNERKRSMERDDEIAMSSLKLASAKSKLVENTREWAAQRLCLELLDRACEKYERERQPRVLRDASEALGAMTGGRWQSVIARVSGLESLDVVDEHSRALSHAALSCGTEQQLYLAVRCGLIREYCSHAEPMPVMIDEALVNFDPERAEAAAGVLADLADVAQIMVFTCHPYMTECFKRTGRVTAHFELDGADIRPLA